MIDTADVVAFLPGYSQSAGARLEAEYCFYTDKNTKMPDGESLENAATISEKELLAIKAIYYLARNNSRLKYGGTWVEDIKNIDTCPRIPFMEAVRVVDEMLCRFDGGTL